MTFHYMIQKEQCHGHLLKYTFITDLILPVFPSDKKSYKIDKKKKKKNFQNQSKTLTNIHGSACGLIVTVVGNGHGD